MIWKGLSEGLGERFLNFLRKANWISSSSLINHNANHSRKSLMISRKPFFLWSRQCEAEMLENRSTESSFEFWYANDQSDSDFHFDEFGGNSPLGLKQSKYKLKSRYGLRNNGNVSYRTRGAKLISAKSVESYRNLARRSASNRGVPEAEWKSENSSPSLYILVIPPNRLFTRNLTCVWVV